MVSAPSADCRAALHAISPLRKVKMCIWNLTASLPRHATHLFCLPSPIPSHRLVCAYMGMSTQPRFLLVPCFPSYNMGFPSPTIVGHTTTLPASCPSSLTLQPCHDYPQHYHNVSHQTSPRFPTMLARHFTNANNTHIRWAERVVHTL